MLVLGVDPGSRTTGWGIIEKGNNGKLTCLRYGRISPPGSTPFFRRIHDMYRCMMEVMERYRPREMAIEEVFYAKNAKSSLKLGHARGAILIPAVQFGVQIFEYSPLQIKKSAVGYGRATKEQVRAMVQVMLNLKDRLPSDTSDALAVAICHINWAPSGFTESPLSCGT